MIKSMLLLRRNPNMPHHEFFTYHRDQQAALFPSVAEVNQYVRRYFQRHAIGDSLPELPDNQVYGTTDLWSGDSAWIEGIFASANYLATIRPDEEKILELQACDFLIGVEHEFIPATTAS